MKTFVQDGNILALPAPYAVASGGGMQVGSIFGVAVEAAALNDVISVATKGVYTLGKTGAQAWAVGAPIYWDNAARLATTTVATNKLIGYAVQAQLAADATGAVWVAGL